MTVTVTAIAHVSESELFNWGATKRSSLTNTLRFLCSLSALRNISSPQVHSVGPSSSDSESEASIVLLVAALHLHQTVANVLGYQCI